MISLHVIVICISLVIPPKCQVFALDEPRYFETQKECGEAGLVLAHEMASARGLPPFGWWSYSGCAQPLEQGA